MGFDFGSTLNSATKPRLAFIYARRAALMRAWHRALPERIVFDLLH